MDEENLLRAQPLFKRIELGERNSLGLNKAIISEWWPCEGLLHPIVDYWIGRWVKLLSLPHRKSINQITMLTPALFR